MKKYKILMFISTILLIISISTAAYASVSYLYLNIIGNKQQYDSWCWVASSKTIIDYLKGVYPSPSQYDIIKKVKGNVYYDDRDGGTVSDVTKSLTSFGLSTTYYYGYVSFNTIKNNINYKRPMETWMMCTLYWSINHNLVVYGYYEDTTLGTKRVSFMDPWPTNTRFNSNLYSWFITNFKWSWKYTWYNNHKI
jgi:hypothetical protein